MNRLQILFLSALVIIISLVITGCQDTEKGQLQQNDQNNAESNDIIYTLPDQTLQKMDSSEHVMKLQSYLIVLGYPLEASSTFDTLTTWAITDFQLQHDHLEATGIYDTETKEALVKAEDNPDKFTIGAGLSQPKLDHSQDDVTLIENPYEVLVLVNKYHALSADFVPSDLTVPDVTFAFEEDLPKKQLRRVAAKALEDLFEAAAERDDIHLVAQSGYRSYKRQDELFRAYKDKHGEDEANMYSAQPGQSEHQSGLSMDVTSAEVDLLLTNDFADTDEGKWLKKHASEFGFIIRYPEHKVDITKYQYEPWHLRYVGKRAAQEITKKKITLEEYLNAD